MTGKFSWTGAFPAAIAAIAAILTMWLFPKKNADTTIPIIIFVIFVALVILELLSRRPALRKWIDGDRAEILGQYLSSREDGKTSIVDVVYKKGIYSLRGKTFNQTGKPLGGWGSESLDISRTTLKYIYHGSHREEGAVFGGDGYARVEFYDPKLVHGHCSFMDDSALEWRHTEYRKLDKAIIGKVIDRNKLVANDYPLFVRKLRSRTDEQREALLM
ncbi:hypothetical protein [Rhodococcus maanshanensis]|uniref:Uncharacterized protein n=1 Tax=Rhodococcus maanshanensis TaxID=183556 RepID=A0A1H7QWC5_9NOCA|nr:hypothetical protein [Rhodococcus maanshanensis]SEL51925.1 hypothetical protein SAMN05444583_11051 [Rhodococcus maanshanensis]